VERPVNALERKMMALTFHVGAPGSSDKNAELLGLVRHASAIKEALANDDDASYDGVERVVFMVSPFSSKAREEALLDASLWAGTSVAVYVAHFAADVDNENSLILPGRCRPRQTGHALRRGPHGAETERRRSERRVLRRPRVVPFDGIRPG